MRNIHKIRNFSSVFVLSTFRKLAYLQCTFFFNFHSWKKTFFPSAIVINIKITLFVNSSTYSYPTFNILKWSNFHLCFPLWTYFDLLCSFQFSKLNEIRLVLSAGKMHGIKKVVSWWTSTKLQQLNYFCSNSVNNLWFISCMFEKERKNVSLTPKYWKIITGIHVR